MKGRGVRIIDEDALVAVTPDAKGGKDDFGLLMQSASQKNTPKTNRRHLKEHPQSPLMFLRKPVATGSVDEDIHSTLAGRLSRLRRQRSCLEK